MHAWNPSNPAVKRLMKEMKSFEVSPSRDIVAYPMDDNIFEWHFTLRGPADSPYADGMYHGKLLLPANYPFAPPDVILFTPNGRFELNKKICVSITSYHPENWNPTFNIAMALTALREFMSTPGNNAIGAIEYPAATRRQMATESIRYECPHCKQTCAEHKSKMDAVPDDAQPLPTREGSTPGTVVRPKMESPAASSAEDAAAAADGVNTTQHHQTEQPTVEQDQGSLRLPPPAATPQEEQQRNNVAEQRQTPVMAPNPVIEREAPAVVQQQPQREQARQGIPGVPADAFVVNVRTLDMIISMLFTVLLLLLGKKYHSGTLHDVLEFEL